MTIDLRFKIRVALICLLFPLLCAGAPLDDYARAYSSDPDVQAGYKAGFIKCRDTLIITGHPKCAGYLKTYIGAPTPTKTPTATPTRTPTATPTPAGIKLVVWANSGEDKVTRDEIRAYRGLSIKNSNCSGSGVTLFGAKNEVVSFNLVIESPESDSTVSVSLPSLACGGGTSLSSSWTGDPFNFVGRDIELFLIKYLQIKGLSKLSYGTYDERHIPKRFRRPLDASYPWIGIGTWASRPDHDKFYPDIAVPIELSPSFRVSQGTNQSVWVDIYIRKDIPPGLCTGSINVNGTFIPVILDVRNFTLPDTNSIGKNMVYLDQREINKRFIGDPDLINSGGADETKAQAVYKNFHKVAHRHRITLFDDNWSYAGNCGDRPCAYEQSRINGSLFSASGFYDGPGKSTGEDLWVLGAYGTWGTSQSYIQSHGKTWGDWFRGNAPQTDLFLYASDESANYSQTEEIAAWAKAVGLRSFATLDFRIMASQVPSLSIGAHWTPLGTTASFDNAYSTVTSQGRDIYFYNGKRPWNGSFATEDDGIALRTLPWIQAKKGIKRWFFWNSNYWNNWQGGTGDTDVFSSAFTFGSKTGIDPVLGSTGWNYSNGDGVLFYPGTDLRFPGNNLALKGPLASLRLKHWRRGIQDGEYLALAKAKDPARTKAIIDRMVPKVAWELGVTDPSDPTWVRAAPSWSDNPDVWEEARRELASIIEN